MKTQLEGTQKQKMYQISLKRIEGENEKSFKNQKEVKRIKEKLTKKKVGKNKTKQKKP
jgi:hypothetical protein